MFKIRLFQLFTNIIFILSLKFKSRIFLSEILLTIDGVDLVTLFGENNAKLNLVRKAFPDVTVTSRGANIKIKGEKTTDTQAVKDKIEMMVKMLREHKELSLQVVEDMVRGENPYDVRLPANGVGNSTIVYGKDGTPIRAKTRNQKKLVDSIEANDIVFAVGPAGTGKTYTAVAMAVRALKNRTVKRIILTRPAVEAGENLGFLPGDLKDKIDPYLRPLYDALDDMFPAEKLAQFMTNRVIEIAPLAFMRGRTLSDAFIILDEAQNTTTMQMKMFLTRLGQSSKCVITGDLSQVDLPNKVTSGLRQSMGILKDIEGISQIFLTAEDVVRHRLVKDIIRAYDRDDERRQKMRDALKNGYIADRPIENEVENGDKDGDAER
jgi:phosphate starvation-inducible protein PhoH and related proteins